MVEPLLFDLEISPEKRLGGHLLDGEANGLRRP